jgi:hypothetical protein
MAENRRETERIQILGALPGDATVHQSINVKELSRSGAQIETTFPLQLNSLHEFRLALGSQSVIVRGRVVHCSIQDIDPDSVIYRAGVEFIDMPRWVADALEQFLDAVKTGRQG